jgi:hypothetical protein
MLDAPELRSETFEIRPSDTMVGAEVLRLDLSKPLDEAAYEKISAALDSFSVVCFRDQDLTSEQHIAFSRRFGPLQVNVRGEFNKPGYPEIYIVSNVLVDGKPIGSQDAGRYWHSDLCYLQRPSRASLLYALASRISEPRRSAPPHRAGLPALPIGSPRMVARSIRLLMERENLAGDAKARQCTKPDSCHVGRAATFPML